MTPGSRVAWVPSRVMLVLQGEGLGGLGAGREGHRESQGWLEKGNHLHIPVVGVVWSERLLVEQGTRGLYHGPVLFQA